MHCSRMLRLCAIPTALLLAMGVARGQVPATPDTTFGLPGNEPLDLSTPPPDESKHKTVNPFASMPPASDWSSKAGIDYRKPSFPAADFQPGALTAGSVPDQSNGVAWATVTAPGFQFPLGWDQTSIETRVDPSQQQSKVGTTLSRSVPVGENVTATLQNGLAVTSPLPNATTHDHGWTSNQSLRFNVLIWYKSSREETWPLAKLKDSKTFTLPLTTRRVASLGPQRDGRKQQNQRPGYAPSVYGVGEINLSLPHAG